mmetsp:Transcript_44064/g.84205  ORF Transcript_44064/g.84205 Transcript_44064/m.84205 type:complete len:298 (-) Transcript_44064:942-1835(-)
MLGMETSANAAWYISGSSPSMVSSSPSGVTISTYTCSCPNGFLTTMRKMSQVALARRCARSARRRVRSRATAWCLACKLARRLRRSSASRFACASAIARLLRTSSSSFWRRMSLSCRFSALRCFFSSFSSLARNLCWASSRIAWKSCVSAARARASSSCCLRSASSSTLRFFSASLRATCSASASALRLLASISTFHLDASLWALSFAFTRRRWMRSPRVRRTSTGTPTCWFLDALLPLFHQLPRPPGGLSIGRPSVLSSNVITPCSLTRNQSSSLCAASCAMACSANLMECLSSLS